MTNDASYVPNDETLPLVLPDNVFRRSIYVPVSALVDYVNLLFREGYGPDTLRDDLVEMYLLDFYISQVNNGGHSQFIHNSFEHRDANIASATRAAHRIGLPELAGILDQCAAFCRANPDVAARQDGFRNRAPELDALDAALYGLDYTAEERADFLGNLPGRHGDDLRDKFHLTGADQAISAIVEEVERLLPSKTNEGTAKAAAELARAFYDQKMSKTRGTEPSKNKDRDVQREVDRLAAYIGIAIRDSVPEDRPTAVAAQVRELLLQPRPMEFSRYYLHSAAWIARYPTLKLFSGERWRDAATEVATASAFAIVEKQRRRRDHLAVAMPSDLQIALAEAMAQLWPPDGTGPFFRFTDGKPRSSSRYQEIIVAKTSEEPVYLCKSRHEVVIREISQNPWYRPAASGLRFLRGFNLISGARGLELLMKVPQQSPGRVLAKATIVAGRAQVFRDLHVPEALMLWDDNPELHHYFHRGVLERLVPEDKSLVWRYRVPFTDDRPDEETVMTADGSGLHFVNVTTGREALYAFTDLAGLRARLDEDA